MIQLISAITGNSGGASGLPVIQQFNNYVWLSGQSNMAGRCETSELTGENAYLLDPITIGSNSAYIRDFTNNPTTWEILEAGVNTSDNALQFGIQPKLAYDLLTLMEVDLYFLQVAQGGKTIANWDEGSAFWNFIIDQTNAIKASDPKAKFEYFIWIQGESDGGGTGYDSKLWALITRLRNVINPNLKVLIVQMIDCQTGVSGLSFLQSEQASVAGDSSLNELIAKGGVGDGCRDTLHFDLGKYLDVADKCYEILSAMKKT